MSNIKDINFIEEIIQEYKTFGDLHNPDFEDTDRIYKALENMLNRIKELEEERQLVGMPVKNKRDGRIGVVLHQWESGSVAVLENINPRIINTHDNWSTLEILTDEVKQTQTKCDSIPVQKVKDKIEELKKEYEIALEENSTKAFILKCKISAFEELLEEK